MPNRNCRSIQSIQENFSNITDISSSAHIHLQGLLLVFFPNSTYLTYDFQLSGHLIKPHKQKLNAKPCRYIATGKECRNGDSCRFSHSITPSLSPSNQLTCNLCNRLAASPYGLLSDCDDVFCLDCITKYKAKNVLEGVAYIYCPICHHHSEFFVPSTYLPANKEIKALLIQAQKLQLQQFKCIHFEKSITNGGKPHCYLFNQCAYAHFVPASVDRFRTTRYAFSAEEIEGYWRADEAEEEAAELQERKLLALADDIG